MILMNRDPELEALRLFQEKSIMSVNALAYIQSQPQWGVMDFTIQQGDAHSIACRKNYPALLGDTCALEGVLHHIIERENDAGHILIASILPGELNDIQKDILN
jgi:hypothetical protein